MKLDCSQTNDFLTNRHMTYKQTNQHTYIMKYCACKQTNITQLYNILQVYLHNQI